jgi:glycosyltransferase involved in cell wall biosynthesis
MKIPTVKETKVSVLIVNYNNSIFLRRCIKSIEKQNYINKEIIVVDDQSSDNSLEVLKEFKERIVLIKNKKKKFNIGSYDQINAYKIALNNSTGKIIFFLDSDDFFVYNKLKEIVKYFAINKDKNIVMDKPIIFFNKKKKFKLVKKKRGTLLTPWPRFSPQSCLSIRRSYLSKIYTTVSIKRFPSIWFDFRIIIFTFIKYKSVNEINKYLTFYQQSQSSASAVYKLFLKNWWRRRNEAHDYFNYINKKINNKKYYSLDFFVTKFLNNFLIK